MFTTSANTLKLIAALIWLAGAGILFIKASTLLIQAERINPDQSWFWLALLTGLVVGAIKTKYLFTRLCYKNLRRIGSLKHPKLWHCYRAQFFIFLFLMVTLGAYMSRQAQGDYFMLLSVAVVDLSIATALLGSSVCFWRKLPSPEATAQTTDN